jgi:hypothetical protein
LVSKGLEVPTPSSFCFLTAKQAKWLDRTFLLTSN